MAAEDEDADLARLTVAAGLAVEDSRLMLAAVVGAVFGSFLNVVAYRLPRGESLARPRSRCPQCETPIRPYDNVPVLSWLALRGRCRSCKGAIPVRYPLVEAMTGLLCALVVIAKGPTRTPCWGSRSCSCWCRSR